MLQRPEPKAPAASSATQQQQAPPTYAKPVAPSNDNTAVMILNWVAAVIYGLSTLYILNLDIQVVSKIFLEPATVQPPEVNGLGMMIMLGWSFPVIFFTNIYTLVSSIVALANPRYRNNRLLFLSLKWLWGSLGALAIACVLGIIIISSL